MTAYLVSGMLFLCIVTSLYAYAAWAAPVKTPGTSESRINTQQQNEQKSVYSSSLQKNSPQEVGKEKVGDNPNGKDPDAESSRVAALLAGLLAGALLGGFMARKSKKGDETHVCDRILLEENKVRRHSSSVLFVHWTIAVSTFLLIFTGFFSGGVFGDLGTRHYIISGVLLFAIAYHITYEALLKGFSMLPRESDFKDSYLILKAMLTGGEEPPNEKFLPEQRLAYAYIAFCMLAIIFTGMVRALISINLLSQNMADIGEFHSVAAVMLIIGIVAHLAAFLFKANRPLLWSIFTGKVDLNYVKHRHPLWYERMKRD